MLNYISKILKYTFGVLISLNLGSCASLVFGQSQGIFISTVDNYGTPIIGATCELYNIDGEWKVVTPNTVLVDKNAEDLSISCTKNGVDFGETLVTSKIQPHMMYGNVIFGGLLGAGLDTITGSAFEYPPMIEVKLKENNFQAFEDK
jgi:hypothetical protein